MQTNQIPDPRQKENQDEQANTADQGNQLLENPNNDEEVVTNDQDSKKEEDGPSYDKEETGE